MEGVNDARSACPLLEKLPLELRQTIWSHVLSSKTGLVRIRIVEDGLSDYRSACYEYSYGSLWSDMPETLDGPVNLSVLRTCKQVYAEAKNLFCEINTLAIDTDSFWIPSRTIGFNQFKDVRFYLDVWDVVESRGLTFLETILDFMDAMSSYGAMKTFTLEFKPDLRETLRKITLSRVEAVENPEGAEPQHSHLNVLVEVMAVLSFSHGEKGVLDNVDKRIVVTTGLFGEAKQTGLNGEWRSAGEGDDFWKVVTTIHEVLGQELWVDGILCFKEFKEIARPGWTKVSEFAGISMASEEFLMACNEEA